MARSRLPRPTDGELAILNVLWRNGPGTVRAIHHVLTDQHTGLRPPGYTTVLKLLQIMTAKGLVLRDISQRPHVYRPCHAEEHTQRQLIRDLLARAFAGTRAKLFVQALEAEPTTPAELAEIRRLLTNYERENRGESSRRHTSAGDSHDPT
jgi:BlaI family transcriptional regulator, penicillinase repressor